tara:strand:+ start:1453 stop:3723 length:2271 start_codon:yes stop_codon:yes gene_type:complete
MNNRRKEVIGILLFSIALCIFISFATYNPYETPSGITPEIAKTNLMGLFGIYISYYLMKFSFGIGSFFIPIIMAYTGFELFMRRKLDLVFYNSLFIFGLGVWLSIFIAMLGDLFGGFWVAEYPGLIGYIIWTFLINIFGIFAYIILFISLLFIITSFFNISIYNYLENINKIFINWKSDRQKNKIEFKEKHDAQNIDEIVKKENIKPGNNDNLDVIKQEPNNDVFDSVEDRPIVNQDEDEEVLVLDENIEIDHEIEIEEGDLDSEKERRSNYFQYKMPILDYLNDAVEVINAHSEEELKEKANQLVNALDSYGVSSRVVRISPGPVITLFEIEPAEGVRVNKFTNLSDDLARVMKAQRVRIIAPIPGSKSVGIELPNDNPSIVYLKNIINSEQYIQLESKLTISLGKTTTGEAYVFDLSKMPHILVAGATGAGKSVCINTMIISILYKAKPDEVKFILVDPKKLELATYKSLEGYHLITAPNLDEYVMTTPENAVGILDSAIVEMERRFQVFADARVRNISEYHIRKKENPDLETVPYVVVVIDELADLMLTSGRAIEEPITRLAQKARAVGIHLIVATQRPSVDVITGVIKSNFPARIAFQVASKVDSRTIIDQMGAEKLLGNGDMLFLLPGTASPIRLHNAFITLDEIESIMDHITSQPKPDEILLPETRKEKNNSDFILEEGQDELLKDAAILVVQNQQASVSLLQRKFRIGYSRAGRLVDELESLGIISGYSGSKAREVLVDESYLETIFLD